MPRLLSGVRNPSVFPRYANLPWRWVLVTLVVLGALSCAGDTWTERERDLLRSLWIGNLGPPPADPSNRVADDPRAIHLGHRLFFEARLSRDGDVACATCHQPERHFTDGRPRGVAVGETERNTRSVVGAAYSPWQFWDGRKDSLWSQALEPLEHPDEHGATRGRYARVVLDHHRDAYEAVFGPLPDLDDPTRFPVDAGPIAPTEEGRASWRAMRPDDQRAITTLFVNVGKALAAYERQLLPGPSPFDHYIEDVVNGDERAGRTKLGADAIAGLRLFMGPAACIQCHNGPLLSNNGFHNVGSPGAEGVRPLNGRIGVAAGLLSDEFNCLGPWSDATPDQCSELRFLKLSGEELFGAVRTPSLRDVARTAPYMSLGQVPTLRAVLERYNRAEDDAPVGHSDLVPLGLTTHQLSQLEAFLRSLDGTINAPPALLKPPAETPGSAPAPA